MGEYAVGVVLHCALMLCLLCALCCLQLDFQYPDLGHTALAARKDAALAVTAGQLGLPVCSPAYDVYGQPRTGATQLPPVSEGEAHASIRVENRGHVS